MASIVEQPPLEIERVAEMLLIAVMLTALAAALVALTCSGLAAATRWIRHRRSALAPGESTFVGRWGRAGPELFVVGAGARRLIPPEGAKADVARRAAGEAGAVLAARMLLETLGRRPSKELTWAFAEERLTYLPADGFTLPTSEVISWLDARHAAPSELGSLARTLAGAYAELVASLLRPPRRSRIEARVPHAREAAQGDRRENRAGPLPS